MAMEWRYAILDTDGMAKTKRPDALSEIQAGVGQRIAWARELVEPNQKAFAELIGVDQSTLNKIEKGTRAASIFVVIAAAARLRVSTDFLLRGVLVGRTDEEMAFRLGAAHPELGAQHSNTGLHMGMDTAHGTLDVPKKQGRLLSS